jgi:Sec-independent protein translocase protein TatA
VFGIGIPEILIIALVAIVFINPKDLPGLFRNLGKGYQQIRRMREDFMKGVKNIKEGFDEVGHSGNSNAASSTTASQTKEVDDRRPADSARSYDGDERGDT